MGGHEVRALLDSGAAANILSYVWFSKLNQKQFLKLPTRVIQVHGIGNSEHKIHTSIRILVWV